MYTEVYGNIVVLDEGLNETKRINEPHNGELCDQVIVLNQETCLSVSQVDRRLNVWKLD